LDRSNQSPEQRPTSRPTDIDVEETAGAGDLWPRASCLATALTGLGLEHGDRYAIVLRNERAGSTTRSRPASASRIPTSARRSPPTCSPSPAPTSPKPTYATARDHLAAYKTPTLVVFEEGLARERTGKLFKRPLREKYL
jgi:acyl-CoA synthetase (AMP-forming)/AMP-acid ligase II